MLSWCSSVASRWTLDPCWFMLKIWRSMFQIFKTSWQTLLLDLQLIGETQATACEQIIRTSLTLWCHLPQQHLQAITFSLLLSCNFINNTTQKQLFCCWTSTLQDSTTKHCVPGREREREVRVRPSGRNYHVRQMKVGPTTELHIFCLHTTSLLGSRVHEISFFWGQFAWGLVNWSDF